ncbi:hypothetical protein HMPREF7215_0759 [Pyramidobacter piscolens W5455]|uniref:Uncharacterized protein n=1 Tax=Pyramidobacter piscolens W5455 TaxID=352165 RepID=A0ABM9ZXW8_9BACT|nr:hypothetical protein HMPREF7215_0759 [Pyramidobacter piscolens W5455]
MIPAWKRGAAFFGGAAFFAALTNLRRYEANLWRRFESPRCQ